MKFSYSFRVTSCAFALCSSHFAGKLSFASYNLRYFSVSINAPSRRRHSQNVIPSWQRLKHRQIDSHALPGQARLRFHCLHLIDTVPMLISVCNKSNRHFHCHLKNNKRWFYSSLGHIPPLVNVDDGGADDDCVDDCDCDEDKDNSAFAFSISR